MAKSGRLELMGVNILRTL